MARTPLHGEAMASHAASSRNGREGTSVVKPSVPTTMPPTSTDVSSLEWDPDSVFMGRQSRSQSLTDPRTMATSIIMRQHSIQSGVSPVDGAASMAAVAADGDGTRDVAYTLVNDQELEIAIAHRGMRRTKSADLTMSMLQLELGYPRPKPITSTTDQATGRTRRASRRSRNSLNTGGDDTVDTVKKHRRATVTSDTPTQMNSDDEDQDGDGDRYAVMEEYRPGNQDEEEDENFLDRRIASVTGYARDTDGVVYYEIVVESTAHGPLSAYKVRRRYSEFRQLHRKLAKIMSTRAPRSNSNSNSRLSQGGLSGLAALTASGYCRRSDASFHTAPSRSPHGARDPEELSTASEATSSSFISCASSCWLPPLPDSGGVWSYFQSDSPRFLENRARAFHAIVIAAQQHAAARASRLLNHFLGPPPDSFANNYVSLNRFAAPTLRFSVEIQERKEMAKTISLKRRQLEPSLYPLVTVTVPPSIAE